MLDRVIEVRTPAEGALEPIDPKRRDVLGIRASRIRKGPGMDYDRDETGALTTDERIYVLEEKDGWLRFRVTEKDQGWSAWIEKSRTISIAEINAAREAKFGKRPSLGFDLKSVECVKRYLKSAAHDPRSIKFEEWSDIYYVEEDGWIVLCKYRGKNAFGATILNVHWFVIQFGSVSLFQICPSNLSKLPFVLWLFHQQLDAWQGQRTYALHH